MKILSQLLQKLIWKIKTKLDKHIAEKSDDIPEVGNFGDIEKLEECGKLTPLSGTKSAVFYSSFPQEKLDILYGKNDINFAEMKFDLLINYYLNYILDNTNNGIYSQTDKKVAESFGISEDKAYRLRKFAIKENFLVPAITSKKVLQVQKEKIKNKIGEGKG